MAVPVGEKKTDDTYNLFGRIEGRVDWCTNNVALCIFAHADAC